LPGPAQAVSKTAVMCAAVAVLGFLAVLLLLILPSLPSGLCPPGDICQTSLKTIGLAFNFYAVESDWYLPVVHDRNDWIRPLRQGVGLPVNTWYARQVLNCSGLYTGANGRERFWAVWRLREWETSFDFNPAASGKRLQDLPHDMPLLVDFCGGRRKGRAVILYADGRVERTTAELARKAWDDWAQRGLDVESPSSPNPE